VAALREINYPKHERMLYFWRAVTANKKNENKAFNLPFRSHFQPYILNAMGLQQG
jgi:hypothetical protein